RCPTDGSTAGPGASWSAWPTSPPGPPSGSCESCPPGDDRPRRPAAGLPLRQRRALGAQRRVLAVARVDPRRVGQPVEDPLHHVVEQLLEPLRVLPRVA